MKTHVIEGHEMVDADQASTTCPRPEWCDLRDGETYAKYVRRHCDDHGMKFPKQTNIEDLERNLTVNCLYYSHKHVIGNRTLTSYPFWATHEFVMNWEFHPDDLEMQLWDEPDPATAKGYTFELKPFDERLPGIYKRFKEVELPRGCQKTSTVCKAYVTTSQLRQRFVFDNIYHRIIITSATTTLTEGVTGALETLWQRNRNIKRLYGIDRFKTRLVAGREANVHCEEHGELVVPIQQGTRKPTVCCARATWDIAQREQQKLLNRDGIYGSKTKNTISARWVKDAEDATGLTAFSVLYAGIKTETQGQRADEYIFDDGNTKKNSKSQARREEVVETFTEQIRQLDPLGRMIVVNTRQHLHDFGGKVKSPEFRHLFHILHRRARYIDPKSGEEKAYYPIDGLGRERYSLRVLDQMALVTPEHEMWAEFQNCPRNPSSKIFSRDEFQIIDFTDPRVPIEVRYGLGRPLTQAEQIDLERNKLRIVAYNTSDLAGKEEQSVKGDSTWIGGHRFDRHGNWYVAYLDRGQWDSNETWRRQYLAWLFNRPVAHDYELPASELHIQSSFEKWKAEESQRLGTGPITMQIDFAHMPKAGKPTRIEALTPWTKNRKVFLASSIPEDIRRDFLSQFQDYPQGEHDDAPDMMSRCLRYVQAPTLHEIEQQMKAPGGPRLENGVLKVTTQQFLGAFKEQNRGSRPNWGLRGRRRRVA